MCRRVRFPYGGILMEFRGLYETGIKTRNIRSVARLSDCYGRLKSKAVLGLLTARGATIKFVGISLKSDSKLRKLCSLEIDFRRIKCLRDESEVIDLFLASGYYQKFTNNSLSNIQRPGYKIRSIIKLF